MDYQKLTGLLKVVAEPNRLQILKMLSYGKMCTYDIFKNFDFTQPTPSHHMEVLGREELIHVTKKSKWHHYSLNRDTAALLTNGLSKTLSNTEDCICKVTNKQC